MAITIEKVSSEVVYFKDNRITISTKKNIALAMEKTKGVYEEKCKNFIIGNMAPGIFVSEQIKNSNNEDKTTSLQAKITICKLASEFKNTKITNHSEAVQIVTSEAFQERINELPTLLNAMQNPEVIAAISPTLEVHAEKHIKPLAKGFQEAVTLLYREYLTYSLEGCDELKDPYSSKTFEKAVRTLPYDPNAPIVDYKTLFDKRLFVFKEFASKNMGGKVIDGYEPADDVNIVIKDMEYTLLCLLRKAIQEVNSDRFEKIVKSLINILNSGQTDDPMYLVAQDLIGTLNENNFDTLSYEMLSSLFDHLVEKAEFDGCQLLQKLVGQIENTLLLKQGKNLIKATNSEGSVIGMRNVYTSLQHLQDHSIEQVQTIYVETLKMYPYFIDNRIGESAEKFSATYFKPM